MPKDWALTGNAVWGDTQVVDAETYRCGYCSSDVASDRGWRTATGSSYIRICPQCNGPTFFSAADRQWPGPLVGGNVDTLPADVAALHEEARRAISTNAHTGAVMLCRKILMHVAVEKGADEDKTFQFYVQWLIDEHWVPKGAAGWLGYIRSRGNEANHEIVIMDKEDSTGVLRFTEALLRSVYELPAAVPSADDREG